MMFCGSQIQGLIAAKAKYEKGDKVIFFGYCVGIIKKIKMSEEGRVLYQIKGRWLRECSINGEPAVITQEELKNLKVENTKLKANQKPEKKPKKK